MGAHAEWLLGYPEKARASIAGALALAERIAHPFTLSAALTLSSVLYLNRREPEQALSLVEAAELAQPHFERAIAIREKTLGSGDPTTNRDRCDLARVLLAMGHPAQALALSETALAAHAKALGPNNPWTTRVNAKALDALGRGEDAAALRAHYALGPEV